MYVIRRNEDKKYVARKGSAHSYTSSLERAQTYSSREAAQGDACDNETVFSIHDLIQPPK